MQLSKKHKMYGGVLVLALGGLAVDQVFLSGGPATAQGAAIEAGPATAAAVVPAPANVVAAGQNTGPVIADRLERVAARHTVNIAAASNAFRPSGLFAPVQGEAPTAQENQAALFQQNHRLDAVLATSDGGVAIINGQNYRLGQSIGGFTLTGVHTRSVVLEDGPTRVELSLQTAAMGN